MVGPCGGHARKDGRTGFSSAAPAALQPLQWPHGVLKRCTCRASTFKMAVQGSQALRLPRFNLLDGTLRLQIQPTRSPQMRTKHHVQPLTNPQGHAQEPHERYRCKTTTKPTAATHQPPATETALEGAQEPSKILGLGARCTSSMVIFFTF